jgi:hypothetical protein
VGDRVLATDQVVDLPENPDPLELDRGRDPQLRGRPDGELPQALERHPDREQHVLDPDTGPRTLGRHAHVADPIRHPTGGQGGRRGLDVLEERVTQRRSGHRLVAGHAGADLFDDLLGELFRALPQPRRNPVEGARRPLAPLLHVRSLGPLPHPMIDPVVSRHNERCTGSSAETWTTSIGGA